MSQQALPVTVDLEQAQVRHWKTAVTFGVMTFVALVFFVLLVRDGESTISLATRTDFMQLPDVVVEARTNGIVVVLVLALLTALAVFRTLQAKRVWILATIAFGLAFVYGFLVWAAVDARLLLPGLLVSAVAVSAPLIYGAMGGVISERAGVVNIAIEGQLLAGAFSAALIASITGSAIAGIFGAMVAGMLVSFVLASFSIKYRVEQVIVGVVLNVLVIGLTSFLFSELMRPNPELNLTERLPAIAIPVLSNIPIIGPMLFRQTIIIYLMYILVALITWAMFRSTWGLRLRAIGEHPLAADTVGIKVNRWRFWNVSLAGAIVGIGGAYYTVDNASSFIEQMTNGAGYIALAAVIFGQWHPLKATAAALLFGFATSLRTSLGVIGSPVPTEVLAMLPYIVTLLAVAGFIGLSRPPAASGKPYVSQ